MWCSWSGVELSRVESSGVESSRVECGVLQHMFVYECVKIVLWCNVVQCIVVCIVVWCSVS